MNIEDYMFLRMNKEVRSRMNIEVNGPRMNIEVNGSRMNIEVYGSRMNIYGM